MNANRRHFVQSLLSLAVATFVENQVTTLWAASPKPKFKLGIGTYTYRSLSLEETVRRLKRLKIDAIELSHVQFIDPNAKKEDFAAAGNLFKMSGIEVVSWFGPEITNTKEAERVAQLAKVLGTRHVSGDAAGDGLKAVDEVFQKHNLYYGIHNHVFHGRKFHYESPEDVLKALSATSNHVGATLDTGHMVSCGYDPVDAFVKLKDRIRVIHLKDIQAPGDDKNVVFGTGKGMTDAVLRKLIQEGYDGLVAIEYEEERNLQADVEACVKFARDRI